ASQAGAKTGEGPKATNLAIAPRPARSGLGHEDAFPRPRLSACCRFRQGTFAGTRGNGRDAPKADHHNRFGIDSLNTVSGLLEVAHTTTAVRVAGEKSDKGTFHGTALRRGSKTRRPQMALHRTAAGRPRRSRCG